MATILDVKIMFTPKGVYDENTTYERLDFVTSVDSTYLYINQTPSQGKDVLNTDYWMCLADGKPATLASAYAQAQGDYAKTEANRIPLLIAEKSGIPEEKAVAQALSELNAKVNALEEIVSKKVLERLEIANEFNLHGKTNMILSGEGAPTMTPDFVGQRYLDTTGKIAYSAFGVNNAGDWK